MKEINVMWLTEYNVVPGLDPGLGEKYMKIIKTISEIGGH